MERSAPAFGVRVSATPAASAAEIERAIADVAREPNSGLVVLGGAAIGVHRKLIITLAARHRLPAVYALRYFVVAGGLAFYGIIELELHRSGTQQTAPERGGFCLLPLGKADTVSRGRCARATARMYALDKIPIG
jgi:hypothetical protein